MGQPCCRSGPGDGEPLGGPTEDLQGETGKAVKTLRLRPNVCQSGLLLLSYLAWLVFMWGLPFWSWYFNDKLQMFNHKWVSDDSGPNNFLCMTPPEEMHCSDGRRFEDVPIVQWRMNVSGRRNVGCGCQQGILGENACPQDGPAHQYSISTYISTPGGVGAFFGLLGPSIMAMWWVMEEVWHVVQPSLCTRILQNVYLAGFQVCFLLFSLASDCTYAGTHNEYNIFSLIFCWLFNFTFLYLACCYGPRRSNLAMLVAVHAGFVLCAIPLSTLWKNFFSHHGWPSWLGLHSFFVFECTAATGTFGLGPMLLLFGKVQEFTTPGTNEGAGGRPPRAPDRYGPLPAPP